MTAGRAQRGQQGEREGNGANDIHLHGVAPLVDGRLGHTSRVGHARVVDEHVELDDRLDDRRYRVNIGQLDRPGRGAKLLRDGIQPVRWPTCEEQRVGRR